MYTILPLPALQDNYIWAWVPQEGPVIIIDPGEAAPVLRYLQDEQKTLAAILITHHHGDHTQGLASLLHHHPCPVYGPPGIKHVSHVLQAPCKFELGDLEFQVLALPGHTLDHIGYYHAPHLFCGDTLFAAGCGRLFEGAPLTLMHSLEQINQFPKATLLYPAHEYTLNNLKFALQLEPDNPALQARLQLSQGLRNQGKATLPTRLSDEQATNPFLRLTHIKSNLERLTHQVLDSPLSIFTALRRLKDAY